MNDLVMVMFILENMNKEKLKVKVFILGLMEIYTMVNGLMVRNMAMVFGNHIQATTILDNGNKIWHMVMVFMNGVMEIDLRENGGIVYDMVKVQIFLKMEMYILDSILMVVLKVMVSIDGQMGILTKDFSKMVKKWEKVFGRNLSMVQMILTCIKVNIKMI